MWTDLPPARLAACITAAVLALLPACDKSTRTAGEGDAPAADASASAPPSASSTPSAVSSAVVQDPPLQLLQIELSSGIEGKEPVDRLEAAEPGMRVYAHLKLRNRSPNQRSVHLAFKVNGESRTSLDLDVEPSWSYRTWAYNTLRKADKTGELTLTVTDDSGATLADKALPIRAKAVRKPLSK
jgi:hypothetical protein